MTSHISSIHAFDITPGVFKAYAQWKRRTKPTIISREVIRTDNGQKALLVFYSCRRRHYSV